MTLKKIAEILAERKILLKIDEKTDSFFSQIENLSCDSRAIPENTLFFAKGVNFKREYLISAIEKGAVAYVSEKDLEVDIPLILVSDVRKAMSFVARGFYGDMTESYPLIGLTGTKGKTSTLYMLESIFREKFAKIGVLSTNEARCGEKTWKKTGTTPEALELFSILNGFREEKAEASIMEVSSQALKYDRVNGLTFSVGAFLNLAPDHISPTEHSSFEDYKESKKMLFPLCRKCALNLDDPYADEFLTTAPRENIITFGTSSAADIYAYDITEDRLGSSFSVKGLMNIENMRINMPGRFNILNALCAVTCAYAIGFSENDIKNGLAKASASGRLEVVEKNGITVLVDYAHNKSSFEAVFEYVDNFYPDSKKILLFGCIGDRALDRRIDLPKVACPNADFIVMTTDDPGTEEPEAIFKEVEPELKKFTTPYVFIKDRAEAVGYAIENAKKGDIVILAGKGGEKTQMVKGKAEPYIGDMTAALEALKN
ncbi:MAG: UDP-N-acetylmuramoyl-L-alanyl-D-glutamate--2,6-diaminopimelate ligase [Clostridia bacterium]|nr:UDP-N-acetylmuramoyl-L-alanyl-D-glutamate--2,6-diaminopimelate ligase [Clostridia bacterium]